MLTLRDVRCEGCDSVREHCFDDRETLSVRLHCKRCNRTTTWRNMTNGGCGHAPWRYHSGWTEDIVRGHCQYEGVGIGSKPGQDDYREGDGTALQHGPRYREEAINERRERQRHRERARSGRGNKLFSIPRRG